MLYPFGAIVLWLAVVAIRRNMLAPLGLACLATALLTALLYAPVMAHSGVGAITGNQYVAPEPLAALKGELPEFLKRVSAETSGGVPGIACAVIAIGGLVALARRDPSRAALFPITVAWSAALLLATHRVPFVRVWLYLTPLCLILVAIAAGALVPPRRSVIAGVSVVILAALGHLGLPPADDEIPDAAAIAHALQPILEPGDHLFSVLWADAPVRYYLVRSGVPANRLDAPPNETRRLFIVVQRQIGFDFAKFASAAPMFSGPTVVARFDRDAVYLLRRQ
jgi:hypothetical protein